MPREWSSTFQQIHAGYRRRDTLDLYLADDTILRLSRGAVVRGSDTYSNVIRSVSDLRTSIDAGVDRVTVVCQNVDSVLGIDLASDLRLFDYAFGDYGRQYQSIRTPANVVDIPQFFRGVVANCEADEEQISFELIVDYESLGSVLASRGLGPRCWWINQGGIECNATQPCAQTRFTCTSEHEFGGWEFFQEPAGTLPGAGGLEDIDVGSGSGDINF